MTKKKRLVRRSQKKAAQRLVRVRPPENPNVCPICKEAFALVVGCHKICRCGYEEGCGD